jgi:putative DNA methylase
MRVICEKLYACSSENYPALLFTCFRKNDIECMTHENAGYDESAWEFMLGSLLSAGFSISAIWPMRSEPASEKADSTRVLIVARKSAERSDQITRRSFINALKRDLPMKFQTVLSGHVLPEDEFLSFMGQGLSVFSKYETVLNADGTPMCVHDALQIIYLECMNEITQRRNASSETDIAIEED